MNFQQLRFVVAVAETRSFTNAADLCCVTQPALSNAIAQLEEELGGKLFERTTRAVTLSTFGENIIDEIRDLSDAKSRLLVKSAELVARKDRTVKIDMSPLVNDAYVAAILARIATIDDSLTLVLSEMNKNSIRPALENGEINFGLCPEPWAHNHLSSQRVYSEPLLYISNEAIVPGSAPVTLETVSSKEILLVGDDCGLAATIRNLFRDNQVSMTEYEGRALGYNVLEKWAQLGIGVALLPASKIVDVSKARRLNDASGATVSINFHVCWKPSLEQRPIFSSVMKALVGDVN